MNVARLILRELRYRKLNFALMVLSVAVAVGGLVAALTMLRQHDHRTEQIVAAKEAETKERTTQLEDDYRKITKNMGFNVLILPRDQDLGDLYADDGPTKAMPEEYAERLARSRVATINHVLPSLHQKVKWQERQRSIYLVGVRGETYIHSAKQKPILETVPPGTAVVGHELHRSLGLSRGDRITLNGREFTIHKLHDERGTRDDVTVWINLREAQAMLDRPGQINAILALECGCEADRLSQIRAEIAGVLPETRVVEFATQALARAEARNRAAQEAKAAVEHERQSRARLRGEREALAAVLVPLLLIGSGVWVGVLAFLNVSDRRGEVGILRALGLRGRQILTLFLGRALLVGLAGAALGYAAGVGVGAMLPEGIDRSQLARVLVNPTLLAVALVAAPLLAGLASWVPALLAARQDPAVILREG